MDADEFRSRRAAVLDECEVSPALFEKVLPRLEAFMAPFVEPLVRREQREHAITCVQGLVSDLTHKNAESIAYRFGLERMTLQTPAQLRNGSGPRSGTTLSFATLFCVTNSRGRSVANWANRMA